MNDLPDGAVDAVGGHGDVLGLLRHDESASGEQGKHGDAEEGGGNTAA